MKAYITLSLIALLSFITLYAKESLMGVVKSNTTSIFDIKSYANEHKIDIYTLGTFMAIEYCDKRAWCKIKGKEQYIPRVHLGIMNISEVKILNKTKPKCIKLKNINIKDVDIIRKVNKKY